MKKLFLTISIILLLGTSANALPGMIWDSASGGNDHSYLLVDVDGGLSWTDANFLANEMGGHLATISSADENAFIFGDLGVGNKPLWLGGYQDAESDEPNSDWKWVTGEAWGVYTNWANAEPNNSTGDNEDSLAFAFFQADGAWNDAPTEWTYTDGGFIVEFNPVPEPATMVLFGLGLLGLAGVSRKKS